MKERSWTKNSWWNYYDIFLNCLLNKFYHVEFFSEAYFILRNDWLNLRAIQLLQYGDTLESLSNLKSKYPHNIFVGPKSIWQKKILFFNFIQRR